MLVETALLFVVTFAIISRESSPAVFNALISHEYMPVPIDVPSGMQTTGFLFFKHFIRNFALWFFVFVTAQLLLYSRQCASKFQKFKLNPTYPEIKLMGREALRSIRGVCLASLTEVVILYLYQNGIFPLFRMDGGWFDITITNSTLVIFRAVVVATLVAIVIGETHFYWTHRLLHQNRWLYQNVHKIHHESVNPDPLSGLSMHPIESLIYFSAAYFVSAVTPLWIGRLMIKMLLIEPLQGHSGHALAETNKVSDVLMSAGIDHYIHHAKFQYNFGANPIWDQICGTQFPMERRAALLEEFRTKRSGRETSVEAEKED